MNHAVCNDEDFHDLPTEELEPQPAWVVETPGDPHAPQFVELTEAERQAFLRPDEPRPRRSFGALMFDLVSGLLDRVVGQPLRAVIEHFGYLVAGALVLAALAFGSEFLLDIVMAQFGALGD